MLQIVHLALDTRSPLLLATLGAASMCCLYTAAASKRMRFLFVACCCGTSASASPSAVCSGSAEGVSAGPGGGCWAAAAACSCPRGAPGPRRTKSTDSGPSPVKQKRRDHAVHTILQDLGSSGDQRGARQLQTSAHVSASAGEVKQDRERAGAAWPKRNIITYQCFPELPGRRAVRCWLRAKTCPGSLGSCGNKIELRCPATASRGAESIGVITAS